MDKFSEKIEDDFKKLEHIFYSYGNLEKIAWTIKTNDVEKVQNRDHIMMYKNKISEIQSKYVALHVGLFWAIGVFLIKNEDNVTIKIDDETMFRNLKSKLETNDDFIKNRIHFVKQLILQRKLKVKFELIEPKENLSRATIQ